MSKTVKRKILFFDLRGFRQTGSGVESFDPSPVFLKINDLAFPQRYLTDAAGTRVYANVVRSDDNFVEGYLAKTRLDNFPLKEEMGAHEPLDIPDLAGLTDVSHWIVNRKLNVLAYEANYYAPRATKLAEYVAAKHCTQAERISLNLRLRQDVIEHVKKLKQLKLIQIRVHRDKLVDLQQSHSSIFGMFSGMAAAAQDSETISISIQAPPRRYMGLPSAVNDLIGTLGQTDEAGSDFRESFAAIQVVGRADDLSKDAAFDLLEDKLVSQLVVSKQAKGRVADQDAMLGMMRKCFDQHAKYLNQH